MSESTSRSQAAATVARSHRAGSADGRPSGGCAREPVTVVRALAHRGAGVLMLRRSSGDSLGGCWELPGGKVNALAGRAEHPLEALAREFEEECGLRLRGTPRLIASRPRVSPRGTLLKELTYVAEVAEGTEQLSGEHDAARWHLPDDPAPLRLTEAAAEGLAALRAGAAG